MRLTTCCLCFLLLCSPANGRIGSQNPPVPLMSWTDVFFTPRHKSMQTNGGHILGAAGVQRPFSADGDNSRESDETPAYKVLSGPGA